MELTKVQITNFQSIQDSTEIDIGDVACLVGKNEAGKTAILKALYRLNPINEDDGDFDVTDDYPRQTVADYRNNVDSGQEEPANVVRATYVLDDDDVAAVRKYLQSNWPENGGLEVILEKGYGNELTCSLDVDTDAVVKRLVKEAGLPAELESNLLKETSLDEMTGILATAEQTEASQQLSSILQRISTHNLAHLVYSEVLQDRTPKFLYFDEYYQMKGQDNLESLIERFANNSLNNSDYPLLGLIELAGLDINQLTNPPRTEELISRLESAENQLTRKVLTYWSQNQHLRMKFDVRPAQPEDPPGMTNGTNIWGRVQDTKHMVTTQIGSRSRGFVWFFSFLAWYSQLRQKGENLILLLDEPGLSLHAKAQGDLLRYFEKELKPNHQLIYTTHSPFMIDSAHFDRVRIVQDLSIESELTNLPEQQQGTKVITEVLDATPDSLFPLQTALGYEISQTLFIGPNCLIVEGPSDFLYIQVISALLQEQNQDGLSGDWIITPVGGFDKISTFVALIGAHTDLKIAVLLDYQKKDSQNIENLYKEKLLSKKNIFTYADFVGNNEADIEDMFDDEFYLKLVNNEFKTSLNVTDLPCGPPRIVRRIEQYLENNPLQSGEKFNHYRPARYFSENIKSLQGELTPPQLKRFQDAFNALNKLL